MRLHRDIWIRQTCSLVLTQHTMQVSERYHCFHYSATKTEAAALGDSEQCKGLLAADTALPPVAALPASVNSAPSTKQHDNALGADTVISSAVDNLSAIAESGCH